MITQDVRRIGRVVALGCVVTAVLGSCAPEPEPAQPATGALVGVLLTEDLPDGEWVGPLWDYKYAVAAGGSGTRLPRYRCRLPDAATTGWLSTGLVAQASAAWSTTDDSAPVVRSVANRYERAASMDRVQETLDDLVGRCVTANEQGDTQASLGGTKEAPVLDELHYDEFSSATWRVRTTWTILPDDVFVQVSAAWRDGYEAPVDVVELLSVAVERAETLPQTSPRPGFPPACEDC